MALTAGTVTKIFSDDRKVVLQSTAFTGATTPPVTYQWHKSTVSGFTPSGGTAITGATALLLEDTAVIPGTQYYYKLVGTDSSVVPEVATTLEFAVETSPQVQSMNQFAQSQQVGSLDLQFNPDTVSVEIDASETGILYAGQSVKMVDSLSKIPMVVACAADSDECIGFINYDIKSQKFIAGSRAEISMDQNVMYLFATAAIARGAQVCLDVATVGGVKPLTSGSKIVGWAYDKAASAGTLIRVKLMTPSFTVAP